MSEWLILLDVQQYIHPMCGCCCCSWSKALIVSLPWSWWLTMNVHVLMQRKLHCRRAHAISICIWNGFSRLSPLSSTYMHTHTLIALAFFILLSKLQQCEREYSAMMTVTNKKNPSGEHKPRATNKRHNAEIALRCVHLSLSRCNIFRSKLLAVTMRFSSEAFPFLLI